MLCLILGTASRTVASTNMNATSSRAHTVVTITFDQFVKTANGENKKSSTMNLVDLAGKWICCMLLNGQWRHKTWLKHPYAC